MEERAARIKAHNAGAKENTGNPAEKELETRKHSWYKSIQSRAEFEAELRLFERALHQLLCVGLLPRTSHAVDYAMTALQQALYKSRGPSLTARPFQHLKVLAGRLNDDQPGAILVFLCLPPIREILLLSVNCDKASNDQRAWTSTYPAYGPSTAERLELRNCPLGEHDIKLALHACTPR